jgi:serine/threonine protein kinase
MLVPGTRLGSYEIVSALGAGGMGEVYRARDTRLKRDVALKILPESFATDPERLARFQREAEALAALNHPHIAAIYGIEESNDMRALVLELVEGETLAERIARGAVPVTEALGIARQVADALEAAHEHGVIHRDLKPANLKVTPDGVVKVLDFGLAKLAPAQTGTPDDATASPTVTSPAMTAAGVIVGTAAYMSPEQAKGRDADKRSDMWSFGCLVFEMLTGRRTFVGNGVAETLVSVLRDDPDWSALPAGTPPTIRTLLRRCLEKDRRRRIDSAVGVRLELEDSLAPPRTDSSQSASAPLPLLWIATMILIIAGLAVAILALRPSSEASTPPTEMRLEINTPPTSDPASFAISPDGQQLVFATSGNGPSRLWLRPLAATTAQPLGGTEGASGPFWSPDSRSIGFFADGKLKRLDLGDGAAQPIASVATVGGGAWNADGVILFQQTLGGPLFRVSASGGEIAAVTKLERQSGHLFPTFLPDGRRFLFDAAGEEAGLYLGSLDNQETKRLTAPARGSAYLPSGWVLWRQGPALVAQRIDLEREELVGDRVIVADPVALDGTTTGRGFSASDTGLLAYRAGGTTRRQLQWVDRSGKDVGVVAAPEDAGLGWPRLSPDGQRVAVNRNVQGNTDVWLFEGERTRRFTFEASSEANAVWSPDGNQIMFRSRRGAAQNLYVKASSGVGNEQLLLESSLDKVANSWSPDGFILYNVYHPQSGQDVWVLPLNGDRKPWPFLDTNFAETEGQFSPDGRLVAYKSNETGRLEIFVRPFVTPTAAGRAPDHTGGQWQVSAAGGAYPQWHPNGKELYYIAPNGQMMASSIKTVGQTVEVGAPVALFDARIFGGGGANGQGRLYDVAPDGRFLITRVVGNEVAPITLIQNWRPRAD